MRFPHAFLHKTVNDLLFFYISIVQANGLYLHHTYCFEVEDNLAVQEKLDGGELTLGVECGRRFITEIFYRRDGSTSGGGL